MRAHDTIHRSPRRARMSRVAVVGSGATGYVALQTLSEVAGDLPVDVFHGGPAPHVHRLVGVPQTQ